MSTTTHATPAAETAAASRWSWLRPVHVAIVVACCALFLVLNFTPLRGTDLWGHVIAGRWIVERHKLPAADLLMPLAQGMPMIDSAWLAQVVFAKVYELGGAEALSGLFAVTALATYLVLARTFYLQTGRLDATVLASVAVLVTGWSRLLTIRPENLGALSFAVLLWLIVSSGAMSADGALRRPWRFWLGIPLVMALWANLHGSFVCGLATLACFAVGAAVQAMVSHSAWTWLADRAMKPWVLVAELAAAATLLNPYGVDLWIAALRFSGNANLHDLVEWKPLVILGIGGREFALSWVLLLFALRHSSKPVPVAHVLLLGLFGYAAVSGVRMLSWYAPVFGLVLAPHLSDLIDRVKGLFTAGRSDDAIEPPAATPPTRWRVYAAICLAMVWITFSLSSLSRPLLGGKPRSEEQIYGTSNPLELLKYLERHPPQGQVFHPQHWGDWLMLRGPDGFTPFVTGNVHLAPRQVWLDYLHLYAGQSQWQLVANRYDIRTIIVDKEQQHDLLKLLRVSKSWKQEYQDDTAAVFVRAPAEAEPKPLKVDATPAE